MEYDFKTVDQKLSEYIEQQNNQFKPAMTLEDAEKYFLKVSDFLSLTLGGYILYEKEELSIEEKIKLGYYNKVCDSCADALWLAGMYLLDELPIDHCLVYSKMRREILDRMYDRSVSENDYLIKIASYFEYKIPPIGTTLGNEVERLAADSTIPEALKEELLRILKHALSSINERRAKILYERNGLDTKDFFEVSLLWENINKKIELEQQTKVLEEEKRQVELAVEKERATNKVWQDVTHTIKNNIGNIYGLLLELEDCTQEKSYLVQEALDETAFIQSLASKTFYSMTGTPGVWRCDVLTPGKKSKTLDIITFEAIKHAISNMFVPTYSDEFIENYFCDNYDLFIEAQNACKKADNLEKLKDVINRYFFKFTVPITGDWKIPIGNIYDTRIRFFLLFNELFLNAIKSCSRIERSKRFLEFTVDMSNEHWMFSWENSARECGKDSGGGLPVISDIAKLFDVTPEYSLNNGVYKTTLIFSLSKEE